MRVAILYNQPAANAAPDDLDVLVQRDAVTAVLTQIGHAVSNVPCTLDLDDARRRLAAARPDVVFNLVEGLGGSDRLMPAATLLLDALGLPYTGCQTAAILDTSHKLRAKSILRASGLPTPAWCAAGGRRSDEDDLTPDVQPASGSKRASPSRPVPGTYIIKAIAEHASLGLNDASIVTVDNPDHLAALIRQRSDRLGRPCFAEQYIDGREFNLSLLDNNDAPQVLPPAEINFSQLASGKPRIVSYAAKWDADSPDYQQTPRTFDFPPTDAPHLDNLMHLARRCWDIFDLRGYARVDFRLDPAGRPWILEINANPCLSPDAGFAAALKQANIPFDSAIDRIVRAALT